MLISAMSWYFTGLLLFTVCTAVMIKGSFIVSNLILSRSVRRRNIFMCVCVCVYIYMLQKTRNPHRKSPPSYQPDSYHLFFSSILLGCKIDCPQLPFFLMILISFSTMSPKVYLTISVCSQFTYYCQHE